MKLKFSELLSRLNSTYWFLPVLMTIAAVAAVVAAVFADPYVPLGDGWTAFLYPNTVSGARSLLSSVVASIITVVSVTFSVTVVALTVASQHFGPRLLDNFMRERGSKIVLGIFLGTFVYSVILLSIVESTDSITFVPALPLVGAVALLGASVAALIYFVHHVASSIQVSHIADRIGRELERGIARVYAETNGQPPEPLAGEPDEVATVAAGHDGYVQRIDEARLVRLAERRGMVIWARRVPGEFALAGTPLVAIAPAHAGDDQLARQVNDLFVFGPERTMWQDPAFAVDKLVEVAVRALSPSVNEPFTAFTCIDRLGQGLARAAAQRPPCGVVRDAAGRARLFIRRQTFEVLLRAGFDPIVAFAGASASVYVRVLDTLCLLGAVASRREHLAALRQQAAGARDAAFDRIVRPEGRAPVDAAYGRAIAACAGTR